jgi:hypothetical protein
MAKRTTDSKIVPQCANCCMENKAPSRRMERAQARRGGR